MSLSDRVRPDVEAAPWVIEEIKKLETERDALHGKVERLAAEVANRNRRALDGDEAVSALAKVHAYYEGIEAERDALLAVLKEAVECDGGDDGLFHACCGESFWTAHDVKCWVPKAKAAINAARSEK